jgi:hypothetical protein
MGRVSFTGIEDYDARAAAAVNAIQTSFVTESSTLDDANFRDEAFASRHFAAGSVTNRGSPLNYARSIDSGGITLSNVAYAVIDFSGLGAGNDIMRLTNNGAGWSIGTGESLRIRAAMTLSTADVGLISYFQLFQNIGAGYVAVSGTEQKYQLGNVGGVWIVYDDALPGSYTVATHRDDYAFSWLLKGPLELTGIEIQGKQNMAFPATRTLKWASFQAVHFKR